MYSRCVTTTRHKALENFVFIYGLKSLNFLTFFFSHNEILYLKSKYVIVIPLLASNNEQLQEIYAHARLILRSWFDFRHGRACTWLHSS